MRSQIVSFHCVLRNQVGQVISKTFNQDVITFVDGAPTFLKGLAEGLKNLKKGEKRRIYLSAQEAYGYYEPDLVMSCKRTSIDRGAQLQIGDQVLALTKTGDKKLFRVVTADARSVTLDANHPLAGQDLVFDIDAMEARDATHDEIQESKMDPGAPLLH